MITHERRRIVAALAAAIPATFLAVFFWWPVASTARRAVIQPHLGGTGSPLPFASIADAAATTVGLALGGTLLTLALGMPAVWALHRRRWPGARVVEAILTAPFALPTVVVALAFLTLQRDALPWLGARHGVPAILGALAFFNIAVVVRMVGPALDRLDERLIASAQTLGAGRVAVALRITWPSIRRAVAGAAAVTFLFCSTSFALVLVLGGTRVVTLEAATYLEINAFLNLRGAAILALVQALLVGTIVVLVSRLARSRADARLHGSPLRPSARRRDIIPTVAALAPAVVLVMTPVVTLVGAATRGDDGVTLDHFAALWNGTGTSASLASALTNSVVVAAVAGAVACALGILAATAGALDHRYRWVRAATTGPLAVSSVVVGVGLLIALAVPLRSWGTQGTYLLMVAAQALVALPLVVRVLAPAIDGIDRRQLAAAATLGAPPAKVVARIVLPQLRPALASAAGLAFAVAVGEFGASVFLARPDAPTLPTLIVRLLSRPGADNVATAAAAAVVLGAVSGGAMLIADLARRRPR